MRQALAHQPQIEPPLGIRSLPLSEFSTGKIMLSCNGCGRTFVPIRGLLRKYGGKSLGDVVETFRCSRCGHPPASACLLSQTSLI